MFFSFCHTQCLLHWPCIATGSVVSPIKCFVRWRIPSPAHNSLRLTTVFYAGRVGLHICQYVNLQDRELLLHRLVPRSEVFLIFSWMGRSGFRMTFPFRSSLPFSLPLSWPAIFGPFSPATLFLINSAPLDRLFCRPLLYFVAPWPPFLPPGLGCTLRGQATASSRSCRLLHLRLYRLGYDLRRSCSVFSDGPLSSTRLGHLPWPFPLPPSGPLYAPVPWPVVLPLPRPLRVPPPWPLGVPPPWPLGVPPPRPLRVPPSGQLTVPPPRPLPVPPSWPLGVPSPTQLGRPAPSPYSVPQASPLFEPPPSLLVVAYLTAPCAASSTASRTVIRGAC